MTQLSADEIRAGTVSHLDQTALTNDPNVLDTYPQRFTELRPFVCVASDGDQCTWAPLSSTARPERVRILDEWRIGGLDMWRNRICYRKRAGTVVGAGAGAAAGWGGAAAGAKAGAAIGAFAGPIGAVAGGIFGSITGALLGGTAGGVIGSKAGEVVDENVLDNYRCLKCDFEFSK